MKKLCFIVMIWFYFTIPGKSNALSPGLDINDVAVLFPLDKERKPVPFISLASKSTSCESKIVSNDHFNALMKEAAAVGIAAPPLSSINEPSDWQVVAFRYDPCSSLDHGQQDAECSPEFRVVAQPVNQFGPVDSALHLIYHVDNQQLPHESALLFDLLLVKLEAEQLSKETTSGKPLGVHPLLSLAADGNLTEILVLYEDLVRRHARAENLKKLTVMGLKEGVQTHWVFLGGNIENGQWRLTGIPNLPADQASFVEFNRQSPDLVFNPMPIDPHLSTFGFFHRYLMLAGEYELMQEKVHALENPALTNRNTIDCLSCHSATSIRVNPSTQSAVYLEAWSPQIPAGITAFPAPHLLQRHRLHWNLRAFGYFGIQPTLSMRTVFEAAKDADQANAMLNRRNPGPDCSGFEAEVLSCFVSPPPQRPMEIAQDLTTLCLAACSRAKE